MDTQTENTVQLKIHLASPPEKVFPFLATNDGRAAFWADSAEEKDGVIHFQFSNGMTHEGRLLEMTNNQRFAVEYFGRSKATFELTPDNSGGTDLTLTETNIPNAWFDEHKAGWVSVLLMLKAAVDFSIDLRNPDPARNWEAGYIDV